MLSLLNGYLPAASIGTMLDGISKSTHGWFSTITDVVAYAILLIGIIGIVLAINAIRKQQPSAKYWIVGVLALIFGGYLTSGGFDRFKSQSSTSAQDSVESALKGNG